MAGTAAVYKILSCENACSLVILLALAESRPSGAGIVVIVRTRRACLAAPPDRLVDVDYVPAAWIQNQDRRRADYLGNRSMLTANHVAGDINLVQLNGTNYTVD